MAIATMASSHYPSHQAARRMRCSSFLSRHHFVWQHSCDLRFSPELFLVLSAVISILPVPATHYRSYCFYFIRFVMSESVPPVPGTSSDATTPVVLLTFPDGSEDRVPIQPTSPLPLATPDRGSKGGKTKSTKPKAPSKRAHSPDPPPLRLTPDSVSSMVAAAVSAALPPQMLDFFAAWTQSHPMAHSGSDVSRQTVGRSATPSATISSASASADAARSNDAGQNSPGLLVLGVSDHDVNVPQFDGVALPSASHQSTLSQPSFASAPPLGDGSRPARVATTVPSEQEIAGTGRKPLVPPATWPSAGASGNPLASGLQTGRSTVGSSLLTTLPFDHVGMPSGSSRASGGFSGGLSSESGLPTTDFRFTGMPADTSGSALGPFPEVEDEAPASLLETSASQGGCEAPLPPGSGLPLHELLSLLHEYIPTAFAAEDAPPEHTSFFRAFQPKRQPEQTSLKVVESPLAITALEKAQKLFRGNEPPALDASGLLIYPSGYKQGKFPRTRLDPFRGIWASGSVPHAPPPVTPADSAFTSGSTGATAPLASGVVDSLQSYALSALDTAALQDLTASALAAAIFEPDSLEFRPDSDPAHVWSLLQALVSMFERSAFTAALSFLTLHMHKRDKILSGAPALPESLRSALRLAPLASSSLFGPAADKAASLATATDEREARKAMVALASRPSRPPRGLGHRPPRGNTVPGKAPASTTSGLRGRGATRSHSTRGRVRSARGGTQSTGSKASAPQQTPQ